MVDGSRPCRPHSGRSQVEEVEQRMTVELDPDQVASDTALVARVRTRVGRTHRVDGSLLTGDGVADRLQFCELELADDGLDVRAGTAVVGPSLVRCGVTFIVGVLLITQLLTELFIGVEYNYEYGTH